MFQDAAAALRALAGQGYIASPEIGTAVFLAQQLEKPVLVEGPAGVGKNELAKAIAAATGRELIRLQCYEGLDEAKALYEWEYSKQLLYTQILKEKFTELMAGATTLSEAAERVAAQDNVFFSDRFIVPRPLLQAITAREPTLLLIDEVDKSDPEFEAFLLEILSDFQVSVPEIGTFTARQRPLVFLTSNDTRELSDALKRRCLHLFIDYPDAVLEQRILAARVPGIAERLRARVADFMQKLRALDLKKTPSISETLDWARALLVLNADDLSPALVDGTLNVLLKYEVDIRKARRELANLLRTENAESIAPGAEAAPLASP